MPTYIRVPKTANRLFHSGARLALPRVGFLASLCLVITLTGCANLSEIPPANAVSSAQDSRAASNVTDSAFKFGASNSAFVTTGVSSGIYSSPVLLTDEAYAGLLKRTALAINYDQQTKTFVGQIRNIDSTPLCDVRIDISVSDSTAQQPVYTKNILTLSGLTAFEQRHFKLSPNVPSFNRWVASIEASVCGHAPAPVNTSKTEALDNLSALSNGFDGSEYIPVNEKSNGFYQQMKYRFSYTSSSNTFRGTVRNGTNKVVCDLSIRLQIKSGEALEILGPTFPTMLSPGKMQKVVISTLGLTPEAYTLQPRTSACTG